MVSLLDEWNHFHSGKRCLAAPLIIEWRDAHEPMRPRLNRERAVRVGCVKLKGGGLDAGLLCVGRVQHLGRIPLALRPPQVHALEHLREIGGVHATIETAAVRVASPTVR